MATAKPIASTAPNGPRRRRGRRIALALAVLLVVLLAWFWQSISAYAVTGAAYAARVGCSCRFVAGRGLDDCRRDFEPGMELIRLSEDADAKSVSASFPLIASQTATFRDGEGCVLETWAD